MSISIKRKLNLAVVAVLAAVIVFMGTYFANAGIAETGRDKDVQLAPGVWESTVYVTDSRYNNVRVHMLKVNSGANVALKVSNASYYTKGSSAAQRKAADLKWGYAEVTSQATKYESAADSLGKVIAGVNGDFYQNGDANGMSEGKMVIEGRVVNPSEKEPFFAVLNDGTFDIREGTEGTDDVQEAVGGFMWVLRDGENNGMNAPQEWDAVTSIGITKDGDVIIVCVDGRESSSAGMKVSDLGTVMQKQGCTDAILLDCGGSAAFVSKRSGDASVKMRNVPNDGIERPVSSSVLVVNRNDNVSTPKTDTPASKMTALNTSLKKKGGYYYYTAFGKKISGFRIINNQMYLFSSKGKGLNKTVTLGNTKYYFKKGKLTKASDSKAGRVVIGFCGANNKGENLLYAYQYGNSKLNIGLNPLIKKNSGKMKNWSNIINVPWASEVRHIRSAYVGKGVKNVGGFAFYISRNPFNTKAKKVGSQLTSVVLADTVTTIGKSAIYNNNKLKTVTVSKNIKTINKNALAYNEKATINIKSSTPPKFSGKVFTTTGKKTVLKVPGTKKWKTLLKKSSKRKKIGFKGKIKYTK